MRSILLTLFFVGVLFQNGWAIPPKPKSPYPDAEAQYSDIQISRYLGHYRAAGDSIGLAYTYLAWSNTRSANYDTELDKFKNILRYLPALKTHSLLDFNWCILKLMTYFHQAQDRYTISKGMTLCDSVIHYAKSVKDNYLEFNALVNRVYLEKVLQPNWNQLDKLESERNRLLGKRSPTFLLYYLVRAETLMRNKRYDEAIACIREIDAIPKSENNTVVKSLSLLFMGQFHRLKKEYPTSLIYLDLARQQVYADGHIDLQRWLHQEYAQLYTGMGQPQQAVNHWSLYDQRVRTLKQLRYTRNDFGGLRMEVVERELRQETEHAQLEQQILREKNQLRIAQLSFLIVVLLVSALLIWFYFRQRVRGLESEKKIALLEGQEHEREKIARDLHDHIGNTLAGIKNHISPAVSNYAQLTRWLDEVYHSVRTLSHTLHTGGLHEVGLPQAVRDFLELADPQHLVRLETHGLVRSLPPFQATMLFRVVQELVTNALRHAQASAIEVALFYSDKELLLRVEDNGQGFDEGDVVTGVGLHSVRNRVAILGGHVTFEPAPVQGTMVLVRVPASI